MLAYLISKTSQSRLFPAQPIVDLLGDAGQGIPFWEGIDEEWLVKRFDPIHCERSTRDIFSLVKRG